MCTSKLSDKQQSNTTVSINNERLQQKILCFFPTSYVDFRPSGANRHQLFKETSAFYAMSRFAALARAQCLTLS